MAENISYKISGDQLIIKIPEPFPNGFCEEVVRISEITNQAVTQILLDFSNYAEISMNELNELARLRVLSALEDIYIEFFNVPPRIEYKMTKASLDRFYTIRDDKKGEWVPDDQPHCPNCGESLQELIAPLEEKAEELAKVRAQLIHLEKLNSIGQLCAGVAHEFNNIMASMKGFAQLALESQDPDITQKALSIVDEQTTRAEKITAGLLSFSRKKNSRKVPTDINDLIERQLFVLKNEMQIHQIQLEQNLGDIPLTNADPGQLDQVFLNIFTNALQAMPHGGLLKVSSHVEDSNIVLRIKDNGKGMKPDVIEHVFDPFFTTKGALGGGDSTGTGLGLSISQGIIMAHNGDIQVDSVVNSHTEFTIVLPIVKHSFSETIEAIKEKNRQKSDRSDKPKNILIIDDEKNITDVLANFLQFKGHKVRIALNAAEGIAAFKEEPADIVLLDIIMPGMNGADCYIELKKLKKDISVAVITGHTGKHLANLINVMKQIGSIELIRKPFNLEFIEEFVDKV